MSSTVPLSNLLLLAALVMCMVAGVVLAACLTGAWINHRAARGQSPVPSVSLPKRTVQVQAAQEPEPKRTPLPKVRA